MKTIIIKTQKEMDDLPISFDEFTIIEIRSKEIINVYTNSKVHAHNDSIVYAYNNSIVYAYDNSKVNAYLTSSVHNYSSTSTLNAYDNSTLYLNTKCNNITSQDSVNIIDTFIEPTFDEWIERGIVYADSIFREIKSTKVIGDKTLYHTGDGFVARKGDKYSMLSMI